MGKHKDKWALNLIETLQNLGQQIGYTTSFQSTKEFRIHRGWIDVVWLAKLPFSIKLKPFIIFEVETQSRNWVQIERNAAKAIPLKPYVYIHIFKPGTHLDEDDKKRIFELHHGRYAYVINTELELKKLLLDLREWSPKQIIADKADINSQIQIYFSLIKEKEFNSAITYQRKIMSNPSKKEVRERLPEIVSTLMLGFPTRDEVNQICLWAEYITTEELTDALIYLFTFAAGTIAYLHFRNRKLKDCLDRLLSTKDPDCLSLVLKGFLRLADAEPDNVPLDILDRFIKKEIDVEYPVEPSDSESDTPWYGDELPSKDDLAKLALAVYDEIGRRAPERLSLDEWLKRFLQISHPASSVGNVINFYLKKYPRKTKKSISNFYNEIAQLIDIEERNRFSTHIVIIEDDSRGHARYLSQYLKVLSQLAKDLPQVIPRKIFFVLALSGRDDDDFWLNVSDNCPEKVPIGIWANFIQSTNGNLKLSALKALVNIEKKKAIGMSIVVAMIKDLNTIVSCHFSFREEQMDYTLRKYADTIILSEYCWNPSLMLRRLEQLINENRWLTRWGAVYVLQLLLENKFEVPIKSFIKLEKDQEFFVAKRAYDAKNRIDPQVLSEQLK